MMIEWLIGTSVLILILLLLRRLLRFRIRPWVQYALWLVVALRLILPVPVTSFRWSAASVLESIPGVQDAADAAQAALDQLTETRVPILRARNEYQGGSADIGLTPEQEASLHEPFTVSLGTLIWLSGSLLTLLGIFLRNLLFIRGLYRRRIIQPEYNAPVPVYAVPGLPSPCLFHGRVYLPLELKDPAAQRHAVAHEVVHNKHYDNLWNLLRCLLCVVFWWNPLVWIAARCSRADMELSCDESAIEELGESERLSYGRTLVDLVKVRPVSADASLVPTAMVQADRSLKTRIQIIARRPITRRWMAALLCVVMLLACLFTFTGASSRSRFDPEPLATARVRGPFDGSYQSLPSHLTRELARAVAAAHWRSVPKRDQEYLPLASMICVRFDQRTGDFYSISFYHSRDGSELYLTTYEPAYRGASTSVFKYYELRPRDFDPALLQRIADCADRTAEAFGLDGWYCSLINPDQEVYSLSTDSDGSVTLKGETDLTSSVDAVFRNATPYWTPPQADIESYFLTDDYLAFWNALCRPYGNALLYAGEDKLVLVTRQAATSTKEGYVYTYILLTRCAEPEGGS